MFECFRYYWIALHILNWNTIRFNFNYFPFRIAIKLPVYVSSQTKFRKLSGKVRIEGIVIRPGIVQIGFGDVEVFDKEYSRTIWNVEGEILFNGNAYIGHGSKIRVKKGAIVEFGENFQISAESTINCEKKIVFGKNCMLSWDILMMDTDFHPIYDRSTGKRINIARDIVVQDNVWIGCRSTVLKGVFIAKGVVVAANSVVAKNLISEYAIYAGNSNVPIRENVVWNYI